MNDCQVHRGPDRQIVDVQQWFGLGHTRLAINAVGPEGDQPMVSHDGRWRVVFNGEIYNHAALRERYGWRDVGPSDGEVIPQLLSSFGPEGLSKLRGMFAICAVDTWERSVVLAVDPLGIKPLYWARAGGALLAASEVRPISNELPTRTLDMGAVATFLHRGAMGSTSSGWEEVKRLRPGTWMRFAHDSLVDSGETFAVEVDSPKLASWATVAETFSETVRAHLMSDVPVSLLMSDGVDSGALALELSRAGANVTALTVDLGGGQRSEAMGASALCRALGIEHQIITSNPSREIVAGFFTAMQRPTFDGLNTFLVCRAVADEGFKVALSGLGGDELLTAYTSDRRLLTSRVLSHLPAAVSQATVLAMRRGLSLTEAKSYLEQTPRGRFPAAPSDYVSLTRQLWSIPDVLALTGVKSTAEVQNLFADSVAVPSVQNEASRAQIAIYQSAQLLPDADAFSMASSVELRVPFVDTEFARSILGMHRRRLSKRAFVDALGSRELSEALARRKQGFTVPIREWMASEVLGEQVLAVQSSSAPIRQILNQDLIQQVSGAWQKSQRMRGWQGMWSFVALNEWLTTQNL